MALPTDADLELVLDSYRREKRPQALVRFESGSGCRIIAASRSLIEALNLVDEEGLARWLAETGGMETLSRHAATRETLTHDLGGGHSVHFSVRERTPGTFDIRGSKVGPADVSNSLTAGIIASITNEETGILFLDPAGHVLAVNETFHRFFPKAEGFPRIGESYATLLRDGIRLGYLPKALGREERFISGTVNYFMGDSPKPLMVLTANGLWANTSRLRFSNGALAILMVDVTEREQEIEQYKSFVQNTRNMIYCRADDRAKWGKVWGMDSKIMAGVVDSDGNVKISDWLASMHPDDLPRYIAAGEKRLRTGKPYREYYRITHPVTGQTSHMLENGWMTVDRATGERYLDCYIIDITAQKKTEAQLMSSEQRFREFANLAGDWYFEADEALRITYLSDGFEKISGMSPDIFMGVSWEKITRNAIASLDEEHHSGWEELLVAWKSGTPVRDHRMLFRFASGVETPISTTAAPIIDADGRHIGYRGVAKDISTLISAQRRAEAEQKRAEAANRAKSEFIANMSHELRTPLNAIIGFAGVMEQQMFGSMGNNRYRGYAGDISASGQHLLSLVNDILDLSRIEADRHSHDPEWLDLSDEMDRVCSLFREEARELTMTSVTKPDSTFVWADRRALRQILINLVGNAVKFTPAGGEIHVSGLQKEGHVLIRVNDTGPGMTAEDIETAMEPFGRVVSPEIAGGTGLGLPISRKLTEMHGGQLVLESTPGQGCSVSISLPDRETGRSNIQNDCLSA